MANVCISMPSLATPRPNHQPTEAADRAPAWPTPLERPTEAHQQPNLHLHLSQLLEWEIWTHGHTRGDLFAEKERRVELEAQMWRLSRDVAGWQATCQAAYVALDAHRAENTTLKRDLDSVVAELYRRQQYVRESLDATYARELTR
jgi:predicted phage-related endonuclease